LKRKQAYKEVLQASRKRVRESEEKREKIGDGMLNATENLIAKNEEIERIKYSNQEVEKFGKLALETQKKWRLKHQEQVENLQRSWVVTWKPWALLGFGGESRYGRNCQSFVSSRQRSVVVVRD
jgi:hypothetical protein